MVAQTFVDQSNAHMLQCFFKSSKDCCLLLLAIIAICLELFPRNLGNCRLEEVSEDLLLQTLSPFQVPNERENYIKPG